MFYIHVTFVVYETMKTFEVFFVIYSASSDQMHICPLHVMRFVKKNGNLLCTTEWQKRNGTVVLFNLQY